MIHTKYACEIHFNLPLYVSCYAARVAGRPQLILVWIDAKAQRVSRQHPLTN